MPGDSLDQLQNHISIDQIGTILDCPDCVTSNKMILDCLVEKMQSKFNLFDLCDKLNLITGSPTLFSLVEDIRKGNT